MDFRSRREPKIPPSSFALSSSQRIGSGIIATATSECAMRSIDMYKALLSFRRGSARRRTLLQRFGALCLVFGLGGAPAFALSNACHPRGPGLVFGVNATWRMQLKAGSPCASTIFLPDGKLQSGALSWPAGHGTASVNGVDYSYIPNRGFSGADSFKMTFVGSGMHGSGVSVITVYVLVAP
jgi:hypothetical protein